MNILVIGKKGQLAWELKQQATSAVNIFCVGRDDIDLFDVDSIAKALIRNSVDAVINACAYTAVDLAETDVDRAFLLNATAVENLAKVCSNNNIAIVHVSTDFVFDGNKNTPYLVNDVKSPVGVYGESKSQGEDLLQATSAENSCIIRTSWVYSLQGNNFVKTMLKLMAEKPALGIISDQIGSPTYAKNLASTCIYAAVNNVKGIHHWTDLGVASWYDFAVAIQELAVEKGLLNKAIPINPIQTKDYLTPAKRPSYSVLDKSSLKTDFSGVEQVHWRKQLSLMLDELLNLQKSKLDKL
ncbi:dTDP-4-dehydrorhamnose reductase [Colwellia sp. C1TZA3]|uniref:dTDP-4-dehydrorhamnose reductase n=1 Tax=Colwellia sp. C1TZA3 TaxID=2508879 RepID=UPI0011B9AE0D|nr:dTDP-4-dehydrorhamnose reductase [Colwellia sp. C1TZA3]TWX72962.1 dTDP-4-dehydrorhamnose reductase [Colwellia sp. C1TZA3]